jgi:hypothetical protein
METADDIAAFIGRQAEMVGLLQAVAELGLPDCWIGAGFVRNAVWDERHGREPDCTRLNDVDVVFFDLAEVGAARDVAVAQRLTALLPSVPWSVKNQARMHLRNRDASYIDTADAVARWPETATAVGARIANGSVELLAPHGVVDLLELIVRPTPAFASRRHVIEQRVLAKGWRSRWPRLRFAD